MSAARANSASKDKRNKIVLAVLGVVLAGLLFIQGPTLLSAFGGGGGEDDAAEQAADSSAAEGIPADVTAPPPGPGVSDSDLPQRAELDELATISRFGQDFDAFDALIEETSEQPAPADDQPTGDSPTDSPDGANGASSDGDSGDNTGDGGGAVGGDADAGGGDADSGATNSDTDPGDGIFTAGSGAAATLSINDIDETVTTGGRFPASNPVFRLVAIDGNAVVIGLVSGAFSTGTSTIDVEIGETRTLVSQPDGTRYRVRFEGTVAA